MPFSTERERGCADLGAMTAVQEHNVLLTAGVIRTARDSSQDMKQRFLLVRAQHLSLQQRVVTVKETDVRVHVPDMCLNKTLNASIDLLSIPQSGGEMSKRLGGIIGCK